MTAFHRTKKDNRILNFIAIILSLALSLVFMLVGFYTLIQEGRLSFEIIFGIAGIAIFVLFFLASWTFIRGGQTHIFSVDQNTLTWGYQGKEKSIKTSEIRDFFWDDSDGFTLIARLRNGNTIRFCNIETVVPYKSRALLYSVLSKNLPSTPIHGNVETKTKTKAEK